MSFFLFGILAYSGYKMVTLAAKGQTGQVKKFAIGAAVSGGIFLWFIVFGGYLTVSRIASSLIDIIVSSVSAMFGL